MEATRVYCTCGATYVDCYGFVIRSLACEQCPTITRRRRLLIYVDLLDEWLHRYATHRALRWVWRPLCDWRERQYWPESIRHLV